MFRLFEYQLKDLQLTGQPKNESRLSESNRVRMTAWQGLNGFQENLVIKISKYSYCLSYDYILEKAEVIRKWTTRLEVSMIFVYS